MRAHPHRPARRRGATRALVIALAAIAALASIALPASPAAAAASFAEPSGGFVGSDRVTVAGTKDAGSGVRVAVVGGPVVCIVADASTVWRCEGVDLPDGVIELAGVETLDDGTTEEFGPLPVRVLGPPRIDGGGGTLLTAGRFTGTAASGAAIEVRTIGPRGSIVHDCPAALPDGYWSCIVTVPSGQYRTSARQSLAEIGPEPSGWSAATVATVDRDVPAAPTIDVPRTGTRTATAIVRAEGAGEPGATLQLYVDGEMVCATTVDPGELWACEARLPAPGVRELRALQRDPAGNFSSASTGVRVEWALPGEEPGAGPGEGPGEVPPGEAPASPSDPAEPGGPTAAPAPGGEGGGSGSGGDPGAGGGPPGEGDGDAAAPPAEPATPGASSDEPASNWGTPTGFGGTLPTVAQILERERLAIAPLIALGYLALIALPLRWFATRAAPRIRLAMPRLTGRNRGTLLSEDDPVLSPAITAIGVFAGAAVVAAVGGGLDLEVRYLRLTAAIGLGLLVLATAGVLMPAAAVRRVSRVPVVTRLLPGILVAAIAAALLSRVAELRPAILIGVLVAASVVGAARFRVRVGLAVAQLVAVAVLALVGWAVHDALTPSTGFWVSFAAETAATVALGGLGSLLLMLLPVGAFPGRAVFQISRTTWALASLAVATVTGAVLASGASFPLVGLGLAAAGIGAVLVGTTLWVQWVEPALA
ncbi:hypothetical protein [Yonghaparkia sp. Soil809]|uniref:hypothetical protein n=1 Tax=Yonghaparkia sp. Soil809 TaxID=1736417 RepID=UPI0006F28ACA|nr:hypothetical protein [Yonghaparkia sp. Soil809]KRF32826.1 hypothetical protein ASG83_01975 [Yonghaparkia sp. Soil809]